jgi:hypothetical protein
MLAHFLDEASSEQRFIEHVDNVYRHDGPKNPDQGQCGYITSQNYGWTTTILNSKSSADGMDRHYRRRYRQFLFLFTPESGHWHP